MPQSQPKIVRSRRKTIALIIQADGSLVVRAPQRVTTRQITEIVDQKAEWIRSRQEQVQTRPKPEEHQFASGEKFWYLGSACPLLVTQGRQNRLEFSGGAFRLSVIPPSHLHLTDGKEEKRRRTLGEILFTAWYRRQARQVLEERVSLLAERYGFNYRQVKITSARTRWGSCSGRGTLSFPWRLVMAPLAVIDYVVVHELVHTVVRGHGGDFWARVQALAPDYQQHVSWLKENGAMLEIGSS
jgi:predicted metal-dependent hydrolase